MSGTVTIDTATGKVLSADLTAEDGSSTVIFDTVYYGTVTQITARPGYPVWTRMWFEAEFPGPAPMLCPSRFLRRRWWDTRDHRSPRLSKPTGVTPRASRTAVIPMFGEIPLTGSLEPK